MGSASSLRRARDAGAMGVFCRVLEDPCRASCCSKRERLLVESQKKEIVVPAIFLEYVLVKALKQLSKEWGRLLES